MARGACRLSHAVGIMKLYLNGRWVRSWFLEEEAAIRELYSEAKDGNNSMSLTQRPTLTGFLSRRSQTAKKKKKKTYKQRNKDTFVLCREPNGHSVDWSWSPIRSGAGVSETAPSDY